MLSDRDVELLEFGFAFADDWRSPMLSDRDVELLEFGFASADDGVVPC